MIVALALALAVATTPAAREQVMESIEARIVMPPGAAPVSSYERIYTADENGDVIALYQRGASPGRRWVSQDALPMILDGGCAFIDVRASPDPGGPIVAACHGEA